MNRGVERRRQAEGGMTLIWPPDLIWREDPAKRATSVASRHGASEEGSGDKVWTKASSKGPLRGTEADHAVSTFARPLRTPIPARRDERRGDREMI